MSPVEVEAWQKLGMGTMGLAVIFGTFKLLVAALVKQVGTLQTALLEQVRHGDGNGAPSLQKIQESLAASEVDRVDQHRVQAEQGMQLAVLTEQGEVIISRLDNLDCNGGKCPGDTPRIAPRRKVG